ncbi:DNA polymerase-3 subunit gamma/tau [Endobacter medicaginis]|uniref:DNA polymerase III subunit gamma/tau n=3 Tax=Endobacter medicaginis TaxID=1181271 RepID=A0A839UXF7_9PROT|nr:DNA polymerase III subunit gamma/tau [Endobacter medicaginis]MBB3172770.1 DNA polymerase-3 subunit gamma/tau [Endobacter medicaginis]MCX5474377.1 DNA polymerase III subunit gamma/tau [Endobacter medicaginis]
MPQEAGPGLFGDPPPQAAAATPYRVLARKYRPTLLADLIGQEAMVRVLRNAFAMNRVAHAFMLTGVRGVGKTTTARIIARALNCIGPDGQGGPTADPCGVCANCTAILADRHPDVMEMDAASHTGVDDIREIIEATRFRPMQARAKVFIIDEVHMLSRNAFNALLKTLEEPPAHVTFIFATTELRKVPVTVLSRCQRFDLRRVPAEQLAAHFAAIAGREGVAIEAEALALVARAADGSVRDGLSLLDQAIAQQEGGGPVSAAQVADMLGLADRGLVFDLLERVVAGDAAAALGLLSDAYARGADPGVLLADLLDALHVVMRLRTLPALRESAELPQAERVRGTALAACLSVPVIARLWQMVLKGIGEIEQAPDRRAAAEMVLVRLCFVADLPTPGDLVRQLTARGDGAGAPSTSAPPGPASSPSGAPVARLRAVGESPDAGGVEVRAQTAPAPAPPAPSLWSSWREVVAFVATKRQAQLHGHLRHSAHLVRFAPPVIELRVQPAAPRDLGQNLAALLSEASGLRWTIAFSAAPGEPTLAEQEASLARTRHEQAGVHPLVQAILAAFPGASVGPVRDASLDEYGLPPEILAPALAFEPRFAEDSGAPVGEDDPIYDPEDPMEYA